MNNILLQDRFPSYWVDPDQNSDHYTGAPIRRMPLSILVLILVLSENVPTSPMI
jgi:hypothetical protein